MLTRYDQKEIKVCFTSWLKDQIEASISSRISHEQIFDQPWKISRIVLADSSTLQLYVRHAAEEMPTCFTIKITGE